MSENLSIENYIDWLDQQPPEDEYIYDDTRGCLNYKFLSSMGHSLKFVTVHYWMDETCEMRSMPEHMIEVPVGHPRTYGAALERAKEYIK